jgi:hypothetical protein
MKGSRTVIFLFSVLVLSLLPQKGLCSSSLNLSIAGNGNGSVHSNPTGIDCSTVLPGTCTALFEEGLQVTLTASPSAGSVFAGWAGSCTNSTGDCYLDMDANKDVTSTFIYWPVRIYGSPANYLSLQAAHNAATNNNIIQMQGGILVESPILDRPTAVAVKGGYDNDFNVATGITTLQGTLTLRTGTVTVDGLIISSNTTPPLVIASRPVAGATNVTVNTTLTVTFNETMDAATINSSNFILKDGSGNPVSGSFAYFVKTAAFKPGTNLSPNTTYTVTITSGVKDLAGNHMSNPYSWDFTTGITPDAIPPAAISTTPADGAINVRRNEVISALFNEAIDYSSIHAATFLLKESGGASVSGSITYDDFTGTATFMPSKRLAFSTTYTATISRNVKDLSGNAMTSDKVWSFTTTAPNVSFATFGSFPIMSSPHDMVAADLNGDGWQDLAVVQYGGPVEVLVGDGTGHFGTKTDFNAGEQAFSMAVADFNADGNPDMAVVTGYPWQSAVSILLGDGTGSFGSATNFNVGQGTRGIVADDFNGDGIPDLVTANFNSNDVSLLIGTGTGRFSAATSFAAGTGPTSIATGDFNKDGKLDLAVVGRSAVILIGTGAGSFSETLIFESGPYASSVAVGDLNNDGNLDLVIANDGTDYVTVLMGDGTGSFGTGITVTVGQYPRSAKIVDLNNDGIPDLVVTTQFNGGIGSNTVYVLLGLGGGTFGAAMPVYYVGGFGIYLPSVAIGDFNGDGKPDIAVADPLAGRIVIRLNTTP